MVAELPPAIAPKSQVILPAWFVQLPWLATAEAKVSWLGNTSTNVTPVARLGPLARQGRKRRLGLLDGKFRVPDDFNEPLPDEVIAAFEGRRR